MAEIPEGGDAPLIRTDFSNDAAWDALISAATMPSEDGFQANLNIVNNVAFDGASTKTMAEMALGTGHAVVFVVDIQTLTDADQPVLCIDAHRTGQTFRAVPTMLWSVENNLSLANMDFDEFIEALDDDGVYRSFE